MAKTKKAGKVKTTPQEDVVGRALGKILEHLDIKAALAAITEEEYDALSDFCHDAPLAFGTIELKDGSMGLSMEFRLQNGTYWIVDPQN